MKTKHLLAALIGISTVVFIVIGTIWPIPAAAAYAGGNGLLLPSSTPEAAVTKLGDYIRLRAWEDAYASLGNKAKFTEPEFVHDLTGYYPSLRTDATLESFEVLPLHVSDTEAAIHLRLHWSTVVGTFVSVRDLHVVKNGDRWDVDWPLESKSIVPPQVIAVNYLRWDVIYRGSRR